MIVLDEQLLGLDIDQQIAAWYPGAVLFITDLRPGTIIKDDAIPALLRQHQQPTFVTINEHDFWRRVAIDRTFCVVCFAVPDSRARQIPDRLRALFRHAAFQSKAERMGKVARVTEGGIHFYTSTDAEVRELTE